jgi:DNA excision repair protein ERCC-2
MATSEDDPRQMKYSVSVRTLCEFTAKSGDLDLRFTPAPSAQEGTAGHRIVTSRRASPYQAEVSLAGEYKHLSVRGRADGYDPASNRLEEIKTFRGDLDKMPANHRHLHWAQVKIYGWLLCQKLGLSSICLALVYFDIASREETLLAETWNAESLRRYFEEWCENFLNWAEQELTHRSSRDQALTLLSFPHASFRPGQRELSETVYRAASRSRCLVAQAPTGIGKTIATIFPLLKASAKRELDKIFFLTAKTSGRKLALDALDLLKNHCAGMPLRVIELMARDKACEHPDKACHGESCPLARGFYDRLPQARKAALSARMLDKAALRAVAAAYEVCPYYLSQDLIRWCDVVVGDYNHYFDPGAVLYGLTVSNEWRTGVLIDEAHNLVERARRMYTAELNEASFETLRRSAPPVLKKSLGRIHRCWKVFREEKKDYQTFPCLPEKFLAALQQAIPVFSDYLAENPAHANGELQRFYFDALDFCRLSESFGNEHSVFDVTTVKTVGFSGRKRGNTVLCLRNIIPAPFLAHRFLAASSTVLFSATLDPRHFYSDTLGLPADTAWLEVPSPFKPEQLRVRIVSDISTRYRHRENSLSPIADLIFRQYERRRGNYLAFFSSFDYLRRITSLFRLRYPQVPLWEQVPGMGETEQQSYLERFTPRGEGIGFAVLGGAFAEAIDLPGERLTGAFVATLGLPQVNSVNEQVRNRMNAAFGQGYNYAYLFPGIRKVVQAAGRVIRTQLDQGVVYLIDDRFSRPEVMRLLPSWWKVEQQGNP